MPANIIPALRPFCSFLLSCLSALLTCVEGHWEEKEKKKEPEEKEGSCFPARRPWRK
jgi:hypothetical protein